MLAPIATNTASYFFAKSSISKSLPNSWFSFASTPKFNIFSIVSILVFCIFSIYISIKKRSCLFIEISCIPIPFCFNNSKICTFSFPYSSSFVTSFSIFWAKLDIAFDTPFSCSFIFFLFSSIFFCQTKLALLILYDIFITLTICSIFSSKNSLIFLSSNPII